MFIIIKEIVAIVKCFNLFKSQNIHAEENEVILTNFRV